ncbi:hypothetical protein GP486_002882, partial [Trichoglossum hirsutum]
MRFTLLDVMGFAILLAVASAIPTRVPNGNMDVATICDNVHPDEYKWINSNAASFLDWRMGTYNYSLEGPLDKIIEKLLGNTPTSFADCSDIVSPRDCNPPRSSCASISPGNLRYWYIQLAFANFNAYLTEMSTNMLYATFNASLNIADIINDTATQIQAKLEQDLLDGKKLLGIMSAVLGIVSGAGQAFSGAQAAFGAASGLAGITSGIIGTISSSGASGGSLKDNAALVLNNRLSVLFTEYLKSCSDLASAVFNGGNLGTLGSSLRGTDLEETKVGQLFSGGKFVTKRSWEASWTLSASDLLRKYLVGSVLQSINAYILKEAYSVSDCGKVFGARVINNVCYSLERPGLGASQDSSAPRSAFSNPLPESVTKLIDSKYGIDLVSFYSNADACQTTRRSYNNDMTFDASSDIGININNGYPECFFSLPVITVGKSVGGKDGVPQDTTPCVITAKQKTSGNP